MIQWMGSRVMRDQRWQSSSPGLFRQKSKIDIANGLDSLVIIQKIDRMFEFRPSYSTGDQWPSLGDKHEESQIIMHIAPKLGDLLRAVPHTHP